MAAKIFEFMLFLALSYGVIYFLIGPKRSSSGWSTKEPLMNAVVIAAVILIAVVGTMQVGAFPTVLLVIALVAFIAYLRSSEAPLDRDLLLSIMSLIGWLKQGLAQSLARNDLGRSWQPTFAAVRRALEGGVARLAVQLRALALRYGKAWASRNRGNDRTLAAQTPSGIDAAVPAGAGEDTLPRQLERRLTRDQAQRLLDHIEGDGA